MNLKVVGIALGVLLLVIVGGVAFSVAADVRNT
jgi:hypothetical protein